MVWIEGKMKHEYDINPLYEVSKTLKDSNAAACLDCGMTFSLSENPWWHYSKSKAMHEHGTGHKVVYVRFKQ
jgi:hypothetical protein